ncbi:PREDICTED: ras-related protein Rab-34-like, partial [Priapulus caudatus]|uniref:Ras-related protein Rab-34-like n=1 Tax=Priapulus caudatus TaxID=37621 RepID=A0ABM1F4N3_PRICU
MVSRTGRRETPCMKMLKSEAERDRVIQKFPQAFHPGATPYATKTNFDPQVRSCCSSSKSDRLKICKAVVVGDVAVGKTCLVNRFCHNLFDRDYKATIGVDFEVERFDILNVAFNLQVWDTAGQERFKCIAASYYRGAHVLIVVFDVSDIETLAHTQQWLDEASAAAVERTCLPSSQAKRSCG